MILGLGEYEGQSVFTAWQLIEEERIPGFNAARGYLLPDPPDNAAIRFGHAFEDAVIELCQEKSGATITDREHFYERDYLTCHIDGLYADGQMHEGKTTSMMNWWDNWGTPGTDRIPQGYQCQAQHNLLLCERSEAIVSVLVFPRRPDEWEKEGYTLVLDETGVWHMDTEKSINAAHPSDWARVIAEMGLFHQYPVAASPSLQRTLVDAYSHFWHTYVLSEREPEIDAYKDLQRAFPAPVGTIVLTEDEERWIAERKLITEEIGDSGRLGKRKEELKVLLLKSVRARVGDSVMDNESTEKLVFRSSTGIKLGSYDGRVFR